MAYSVSKSTQKNQDWKNKMKNKPIEKEKKILMFKDDRWVNWDGSDVSSLLIKETMTLKEFKKHFPNEYKKYKTR